LIRWITPQLGTGACQALDRADYVVVDVRDLVDGSGNADDVLWQKISTASHALMHGQTVVACCDYGISRSNSIAIAALAHARRISFAEAQRIVIEKTGESEMRLDILNDVRRALERRRAISSRGTSGGTILLTGASGNMGQAIAAELADVLPVIPTCSADLDLARGGAALDLLVKENNVKHLVHLAHPRRSGTNSALGTSMTMLKNAVDVCIENEIHLIYVSSWEVFSARGSSRLAASEAAARCPESMIGLAKSLGESMLETLPRGRLSYAVARPARLYGGKTTHPRVLLSIADACVNRGAVPLHRFQNGFALLDFVHVEDFAAGLKAIVRHNSSGIFHFGGGAALTTQELVARFAAVLGRPCQIEERAIQGWAPNVALTSERADRELRWQPRRRVGDALADVMGTLQAAGR
jgi:UDP-glucuronate decarboxylase